MAEIGKIQRREIVEEMRESYLDYAMSVIVARALPDVRDGLKPVHRRILYTLHEMGLTHGAKFRKSAAIVGDCLGKYHPHGDIAVYDSLVRMAQPFALRYPLVDGQGNWGSVDGDSAAAQRYTEARMTRLAEELLKDIEKDTVSFAPNYDATRTEPTVLPAALPNLLLNGSMGIAVGMATSIPPHNLGEIVDALLHLIERPDASTEALADIVKGPDFPTGGMIFNEADIKSAYATGRGAILMRGVAEIVEGSRHTASGQGRQNQIIITEIPYQVNKAELVEKIAELVRDKKIEGIRDLRDESDKDGLRVAVDLKADAFPQKVLNSLYKFTDLEKNFNLNMLALVDGIQPQVLSLKGMLEEYLKHRKTVVRRRSEFELARARERIHILEGLSQALNHIDAVIQTIKRSADRDEAAKNLVAKFKFSAAQAAAILEMRLQTLAGLERRKIEDELAEKRTLARKLEAILKDQKKILGVVTEELSLLKRAYADPRKTKVIPHAAREIATEDIIPEEEMILVLTRGGYTKRIRPEAYRMQKRGGKGTQGMETKEEDVVEHFLTANTHADLLFFTSTGKVFSTKAYEIPEGSRTAKGKAIFNFLSIKADERIRSLVAIPPQKGTAPATPPGPKASAFTNASADAPSSAKASADAKPARPAGGALADKTAGQAGYLVMVTERGMIKKVREDAFANVRKSGIVAITLKGGDALAGAALTSSRDDILLVTARGQAIRFADHDVRPMGRGAAGVRAVRLKKDDHVRGVTVIKHGTNDAASQLLVVCEQGFGKKTSIKDYKRQKRGGSGIKTAKITPKTGAVVASALVREETELIAISQQGQVIRTRLADVPTLSRATQGVRIMKLGAGDHVASATTL